jgi:uncharacterized protein (TIGR02001 family)
MEFSSSISLARLVVVQRREVPVKHLLLGFLIATVLMVLSGTALAQDWGHHYGYVDWTSDYRFYGASESDRHPTVQGGLHWAMPDNYYAGVFVTGVDFRDFRHTSYEVDVYGGRHFIFGHNDLNLELLYSDDPDTAGHPSYALPGAIYPTYNFMEASADLTRSFGTLNLGAKVIVEPRPESHGGLLWSMNGEASYDITDWLKATGTFGHQWAATVPESNHWDVGMTATWRRQWALDVRYYGSDITRVNCYNTNWCEPAVVAKVTYSFVVL